MMQKTLSRETIASVLVFVSFAVGAVETPPQIFKPGSVILFQGDSITHGGRMGDMNHFLGHGYQAEIAMRYLAYRPNDNLQFGNRGESGHTSSNLVARWHRDAFPYEARRRARRRVREDGWRSPGGQPSSGATRSPLRRGRPVSRRGPRGGV